ncbi:universal stress protein [Nonomuraea thailandensis]
MIIAGVDGSVASRAAVEWAAADAARRDLPLRIVHVVDTSWYLVGKRPDAPCPTRCCAAGGRCCRRRRPWPASGSRPSRSPRNW